jgi:hypothetical protein
MYRSFTIKNFRCFRDFTLDSLERVNLIAGQNNVGKTALLEALFLHLGPNNPDLSVRINVWRGFQRFGPSAEDVWNTLFFDLNTSNTIELASVDEEMGKAVLLVSLAEPETTELITPDSGNGGLKASISTVPDIRQLKLEYHDAHNQTTTSWATATAEGTIQGKLARMPHLIPGVFISTAYRSPQEDAERFSEFARFKRQGELVETLRILEPRLQHLEIQSVGGVPFIWGDIGLSQLLPLPMTGQGMVRLLSTLAAINSVKGGIVLIDEVENGLHYSVMTKVWTAIAQAARDADVQIFATTHSWECITAAHEAFHEEFKRSGLYDFRLHRLDRVDDEIRAVTLDQEMLDTAIKAGLEVR